MLLRNICGLNPPATGWDALPSPTDLSPEADIARIKFYRNTAYAHATHASIDDAEFDDYWTNLRDAIVRLGGDDYAKSIDDQRWDFLDRQHGEDYKDVIKEWNDGTMNKLGNFEVRIAELEASLGYGRQLEIPTSGKSIKCFIQHLYFVFFVSGSKTCYNPYHKTRSLVLS